MELLVVMAIIMTLAGIGFGTYMLIIKSSKEKETELIINAVAEAMEARSADISSAQRAEMAGMITSGYTFPDGDSSDGSTQALVRYISGDFDGDGNIDVGAKSKVPEIIPGEFGQGSYLNSGGMIVDSWDRPIRYTFPGVYHTEDDGFDLRSAGPDGIFDNEDDIILK